MDHSTKQALIFLGDILMFPYYARLKRTWWKVGSLPEVWFFEWIMWQKFVPLILTLSIASLNGTSPGIAGWLLEGILYQFHSGGIQNSWVSKSFYSPTRVHVLVYTYAHINKWLYMYVTNHINDYQWIYIYLPIFK